MTPDTKAAAATAIDALRHCVEAADWDRLDGIYAPNALLDANVPQWRFQRKGPDEIAAQYREWYPGSVRIVEWTATPTSSGAVVEQAEWSGEGAEQGYSRSIHLLRVGNGDRIVRHVLYCTGFWPLATVERQSVEAPMYES